MIISNFLGFLAAFTTVALETLWPMDAVGHTLATDCVCGPTAEGLDTEKHVYRHHHLDPDGYPYQYIAMPESLR